MLGLGSAPSCSIESRIFFISLNQLHDSISRICLSDNNNLLLGFLIHVRRSLKDSGKADGVLAIVFII